ncbi:MAG: hypothetical protein M5U01_08255 [Ardenticatenaceae bacterium]|nr:hypothetical protein [Ardenticatenaceae bacterium]
MSTKRMLLVVLAAGLLLLAGGLDPRLAPGGLPGAQAAGPDGSTIPYTGRLTDEAGSPAADGVYDFIFTLYDVASGGDPLWAETQQGVPVQAGSFAVLLGHASTIPADALAGGERWLAVAVRGPGESDFTPLAPRQPVSSSAPASPAAGPACPHDHWGEEWSGSGIGLKLVNPGGNQVWLPGGLAAVFGDSQILGGVWGRSQSNIGVLGESNNYRGVVGKSTTSYGGFFESGNDHLDLALGGAVGRINSDPGDENSVLYLSSNADVIIKLDNDGGENNRLRVVNSGGGDVFTVDESGNLAAAGSKSAVVETANHGSRLLYAVESPEVWFEDFGAAALVAGEATVAFDPVFGETVNPKEDYHVFVTPLCDDPVLLSVTSKQAAAFTVRGVTLDGQPAECSFDYRIVARRRGYESVRLAPVSDPPGLGGNQEGRR